MKPLMGSLFGIWLAVTGFGVLAFGIAWAEWAPMVYILWVIITGLGLIGAGAALGFWAAKPEKTGNPVKITHMRQSEQPNP